MPKSQKEERKKSKWKRMFVRIPSKNLNNLESLDLNKRIHN